MAEVKDKLLTNAGGLLMAAGCIAAFTGGMYGLAHTQPTLVVLSVMLLIGYGVVGYLLMSRGPTHFHFVLPATAVLVLLTLFVLRTDKGDVLDSGLSGDLVLYPTLALILSFAGGALLTHAIEEMRVPGAWPGKGAPSLNPLLHIAAAAPIWCAFVMLDMLGRADTGLRVTIVGASVFVAIACVVAGYAAARRGHPGVALVGSAIGFLASVAYLFQFMLTPPARGVDDGMRYFGEFLSLLGLILTGLPIAISAVGWIQMNSEEPQTRDEPPVQQPFNP